MSCSGSDDDDGDDDPASFFGDASELPALRQKCVTK
jgi:hypothetical protein